MILFEKYSIKVNTNECLVNHDGFYKMFKDFFIVFYLLVVAKDLKNTCFNVVSIGSFSNQGSQ